MIKEVVLENVKSYEFEKFSFTEGLNAIIGENGAGKTTILEAIGFALFDSLPYKISDFLRRGMKKGSIRISFFSTDGREYVVTRNITETGTSEFYISDREVGKIAEGKEVLQWVNQAFKIEGDQRVFFENAIGVLQGRMTAQFLEPPSVRDKIFSPIIGVESYKRAYEKSRDYENYLSEKLVEVEKLIFGLEKELEQKSEVEDELETLQKQKGELLKKVEAVKKELFEKNRKLEKLEKLRKDIDSLLRKVSEVKGEISLYKKNLQDFEEKIRKIREVEIRIGEIEKNYLRYVEIENKIKLLEEEEKELSQRYEIFIKRKNELQNLGDRIKSLSEEISEISKKGKDLKSLKSSAEKEKKLVEEIQKIELAEMEFKRLDERKENVKREISKIGMKVEELAARKKKLLRAVKSLEKLEGLEEKREMLIKKKAEVEHERAKLKEEMGYLRGGICPVLEEECNRIAGKKAEVESKLSRIERSLEELQKRLEKINDLYNTKRKLENVAQKLSGEIKNLQVFEDELSTRKIEIRDISSKLEKLKGVIQNKEVILKEYEKIKGSSEKLAALKTLLAEKEKKEAEIKKLTDRTKELQREIDSLLPEIERYMAIKEEIEGLKKEKERHGKFYEEYVVGSALIKEKDEVQSRINELKSKIRSLEDLLKDYKEDLSKKESRFSEEEFEGLRRNVVELTSLKGNIEGQIDSLERTIEERKEKLVGLKKKETKYKDKVRERENLKKKLNFIKDLREIFKLAIPEITKAYVQSVSVEANRIFCEIMEDYNWELRWTEDYGIKAKYRGREIEFAQMSGGEQMCAAIAVRLALLNILSDVGIAFFDEPTQNMDERRRRNLATQLSRIDGFRQIFVISHDDTFEEMVENAIKVTKENGVSRQTRG